MKVNKEEIILIAGKLFSQMGYYGTSMNDIAGACQVRKGTLYYYFEHKNDLLRKVVDHFILEFEKKQLDKLYGNGNPKDLFKHFIIDYYNEIIEKNSLFIISKLAVELSGESEFRIQFRSYYNKFVDALAHVLSKIKLNKKSIKAYSIVSIIEGSTTIYIATGNSDFLEKSSKMLIEMIQ